MLICMGFILKPTERAYVPHKTVLGIFKITLRLRDPPIFIWQSMEILNVFITLTLQQIFWKTENFFEKLEYRYLVERTTVSDATFSYKTPLSKTSFKANRMGSTIWTYHKEWSFAINYFHIFENLIFEMSASYTLFI